ncbi:FIMAH domain-containing protein [Paenibacillus sp. GCM10012303]|uniref:FIMAH domain-containing protein n=1 Tax=Paenibacillus sp. GCM10012303 TaxID=3317340 RepID=UPI00360A74AE
MRKTAHTLFGRLALCILLIVSVSSVFTVSGPVPAYASGDLLHNGGFEQNPGSTAIPGWTPYVGTEASLDSQLRVEGTYSLRIQDVWTDKSGGVYSASVPALPGEIFRATSKVNVVSGGGQMHLEYLNASGQRISRDGMYIGPTNGAWFDLQTDGTLPAGTAYIRVLLYCGAAELCDVYFDKVKLERRDSNFRGKFDDPVLIPDAVPLQLGQAAAVGETADGQMETYFFSNGAPGTFYALDAWTGERKFAQQVPGTNIVWAMTIGADRNVYFASSNNGRFYKYDPVSQTLTDLGVNPSGRFVWSLQPSPDGNYLYGATYPGGHVFEYAVGTGVIRDLGNMKQGKDYAQGVGVTDQYLYVGVGPYNGTETRMLVRYDRETGAKLEIPTTSKGTFIQDSRIYGGKLFVESSRFAFVIDETTHQTIGGFPYSGDISSPYPLDGRYFYYKYLDKLFRYDLNTNARTEMASLPDYMKDSDIKALAWGVPASGSMAGHTVLLGVTLDGESFIYDPQSGVVEIPKLDMDAQGVSIQTMSYGPDRNLYIGGYHKGVSVYNTVYERFDVKGEGLHQIEGVGYLNGKAYFGVYAGARLYEYDPAEPWNFVGKPTDNPHLEHVVSGQDRPFIFETAGSKLFTGTIPAYGKLGGSLTVYDSTYGTWKEYDHSRVVPNQSVIGLAHKDGKLYGSTSIFGGLGINPTETEAKLFVWDIAGEQKLLERTLEVPGLEGPLVIGDLEFGPDGLLWGASLGTIFALDPDTLEVVKSRVIYNIAPDKSQWRPIYLIFGADGLLYTNVGLSVTVIDPQTLDYEQFAKSTTVLSMDHNGSLYYASNSKDIAYMPIRLGTVAADAGDGMVEWGASKPIALSASWMNGRPVDLSTAEASRWIVSDPNVTRVVYGQLEGLSPGKVTVVPEVTVRGRTVQGDPLEIVVRASTSKLGAEVERLRDQGILSQSLYAQLSNNLRQAEHFIGKGNKEKASEFMNHFVELATDADLDGTAGADAKRLLLAASRDLIAQWGAYE